MKRRGHVSSARREPKKSKGLIGRNSDTIVYRRKSESGGRNVYRQKSESEGRNVHRWQPGNSTRSEGKLMFFRGYPQLRVKYERRLKDVGFEK